MSPENQQQTKKLFKVEKKEARVMSLNSLFSDDIENIVFLMAEFESTSLI